MTETVITSNSLEQIAEGLRILHDGPLAPKPGQRLDVRLESVIDPLSVSDVRDVPLGNAPGGLSGILPLAVQVPVQLNVDWRVFLTAENTELKEGQNFQSLPGSLDTGGVIKATEVSFLFQPLIREPTQDQLIPGPVPAEISASVTLTAQPANGGPKVTSPTIELRLPILLPVIPLPTVLALFRHINFLPRDTNLRSRANFIDTPDGFVLLVVPEDSPLKALTHLFDLLNTVGELGSLVGSLLPAHARLLLGLQKLTAAIGTQPHLKFRAVRDLSNLNAVVMIQRDLTHNDIEVEDEVSSLILIGPPEKTKVSFFNARDLAAGEGQLDVETGGAGVVVIRDLHTAGTPVSETGGTIDIKKASTKKDGFGQAISSLRFAPQVGLPQLGPLSRVGDKPLKLPVGVAR